MNLDTKYLLPIALVLVTASAGAAPLSFSGHWFIDLRTPNQRQQNIECGGAGFELEQRDDRIIGSHSMSTAGCGRLNEGGEETVKGVVVGRTAVLVVTSGRNGAVVMGTARLKGGRLYWQTLEQIRPGQPEGDSPLILERGTLIRTKE